MMNNPIVKKTALVALALLAGAGVSRAQQNGVWTGSVNDVWSDTASWQGGLVADGTGATADFSQDLANGVTVTMDASHNLGTLLFGDPLATTANNWILTGSGGSVLTLAGTTPTITVNNGTVTNVAVLALPLAGTSGLTETGNGTLFLAGSNNYSGNTVVSAGTLRLTNTVAGVSTTDPVLYMSFDNVSGDTVFNQGTGGAAMNGVLLGGATIVPGGKYGKALYIPSNATQGSATPSSVLINNAVVTMNINTTTSWTLAMWLQSSTPGGCYFYQGNGGWASANTKFYLIQNTLDNDGVGTHAGGVSYGRSWEQGTAVVADGNWHFVVFVSKNGVNSQYVDGVLDTMVENQWTGSAGTTSQCRIGGGPTVSDTEVGLGGLIDEVYMYNYALSQAQITALMSTASGPTDVPSALPATTSVSVAAPATLDVDGSTALVAGLSGAGTVDNTTGSGTLVVNAASSVEFDGVIKNTTGALSLNKIGAATLTLGGINTYTGATLVNGGTLNITGSLEPSTTAASSSGMTVRNGMVNFSGAFLTNYNYNIGTTTNFTAALYQTAGILKESQGANGVAFQLGSTAYGYGYYYIGAGATAYVGEIGIGGEGNPSGNGQLDIKGGTVNDSGWLVIARGGNAQTAGVPQTGILNVYPGSSLTYAGGGIVCNWGSGGAQTSIINLMGGTVTLTAANEPINLNDTGNGANTGILNLNGGSIQAGWVSGGANGTRVNFNGGTLAATENQGVMMTGLAAATVYSGGGTINNNGFAITIGQQFLAPGGNGVNSINSFTGGAGYIAPPIVAVVPASGDAGVGATAIAQIDSSTGGATSGQVTNVLITCPGVNYTLTPTFTLTGGGATTPATITGAAPTANVSGGLTFSGSGTTTLTGGYTYTGPTVLAAGTLSLGASAVTPSVAGALTIGANATLTLDTSSGTALRAGGLTLQSPATNNLNYGTLSANPTTPAIQVAGSVSLPGSGAVLNISAFGLKTGTFPLIKYTGTQLASLSGLSLGLLPPGVVATLANNAGEIDLVVTGTGQNLQWYGLDADSGLVDTNWGINAPTNWVSFGTTTGTDYKQYTNGIGTVVGDPVTFDDNAYVNNGTVVSTVWLTNTVQPYQLIVNSGNAYTYSFFGPGGVTGMGVVVMSNGSLTLGTSNSYTGGTLIYGGTVIVSNSYGLGAASSPLTLGGGTLQFGSNLTNSGAVSVTAASTIDVQNGITNTLKGPVTGSGALTLTDAGTLVLAGTNNLTGVLSVNQGTLITTSTNTLTQVPIIGNLNGYDGFLRITGGSFLDTANPANVYNTSLTIGGVAGAAGDVVMTAGTLTVPKQLTISPGPSTYGGFSQSGGTTTIGGFIALGGSVSGGVLNQSGGTITMTNSSATIGYNVSGAFGVMNLSGGAFNITGAGNGVWPGEVGNGTLNVSGSAVLTITNGGLILGKGGTALATGAVNLLGGTTTVNSVSQGAGTGTFNFNGGTLKANLANSAFMTGLTYACVYNGGATIDDGGLGITIAQPLLAPNGYGVSSIALAAGANTGYDDTPIVTISGGAGSNAMATATVANGAVTGIIVTCPGSGYLNSDTLSVNFTGGGPNANPPNIGTISFVQNNGTGGLTKQGAGTLALTGVNTFAGPITNKAGTLSLNSASTYAGSAWVNGGSLQVTTAAKISGNVTVTNGAAFGVSQIGTGTETIGNLQLGVATGTNAATLSLSFANGNSATPLLNCGTLTLNGTNMVSIAGRFTIGVVPLVKYTGTILGPGSFSNNIIGSQGLVATISNYAAGSTLYAVITSTGPGLVWTGTNSSPTLTNVWDIGSTTNWLVGSTPTTYQETAPPGDTVAFNDVGDGTVIVSNTVDPFSLLISNNAVNYTFQGPAHIAGSAGITKLGTGTATLNLTNDAYAGDTVISNGELVAGSATALSSAANLNLGPNGLLELNGFSESVNALTGSGAIDDNSALSPTLTVNGGGTWNGTISNTGSSGLYLTQTGNNTMVIGGSNYLNAGSGGNGGVQVLGGGTMIITNHGLVSVGNAEFWIAQGATTGNVVVGGGTLLVNNWLVVGRNNASAVGTMTVNSGLVQKAGGANIVLGSLGATGTLIVNGGMVLNNGEIYVGEGPTGHGTLQLNGGLIQATVLRPNNNGGLPVTSVAYFNGGTLQATASSADFIQCSAVIQTNGLVLDDGGYALNILTSSLQGDSSVPAGGLTKMGAGTVYLDAANSYTGTTLVNNGTLAGAGSINGPVVVSPAGSIGAGDAGAVGTLTLNSQPLTIQGAATMRISATGGLTSDQISGISTLSYGGTLVISNATSDGTALQVGNTFALFNATSSSGNFSSIIGSPGAELAYKFTQANGIGTLSVVTGPSNTPPTIGLSLSGTALTISWPADHLGYVLQSNSINVANPNDWFNISGSDSVISESYNISTANTNVFFRLVCPNCP
jgi:autotransporter-associated beta strand protein